MILDITQLDETRLRQIITELDTILTLTASPPCVWCGNSQCAACS
jgi:hypothetical protein